jgi:hypothetical protein
MVLMARMVVMVQQVEELLRLRKPLNQTVFTLTQLLIQMVHHLLSMLLMVLTEQMVLLDVVSQQLQKQQQPQMLIHILSHTQMVQHQHLMYQMV